MKKIVTSDVLRIIAMVSMLIDHSAIVIDSFGCPSWIYWIMRGAGRLALPIYAYFIVQGFIYTRSVAKYEARLLITAVVSEIPYNMMVSGQIWCVRYNNILFNLALALFVLWATQKLYKKNVKYIPFMVIIVLWAMAAGYILGLDYSWRCILLIVILYYFRNYKAVMYTAAGVDMIIDNNLLSICSLLSFIPIHLHDGARGKIPRQVIYLFYPSHLLVLGLIRILI